MLLIEEDADANFRPLTFVSGDAINNVLYPATFLLQGGCHHYRLMNLKTLIPPTIYRTIIGANEMTKAFKGKLSWSDR